MASAELLPELALCAAVVRQTVLDLHDSRPWVRLDAIAWWQGTKGSIHLYSELLGIDLQQHRPSLARQPRRMGPRPKTPQLALF